MLPGRQAIAIRTAEGITINLDEILSDEKSSAISCQLSNDPAYMEFTRLYIKERLEKKASPLLSNLSIAFSLNLSASYCENQEDKNALLQTALHHYEQFQSLDTPNKDIHYFVQWQMGLVQELLGFSWTEVEATLLMASNYYSGRGEAMKYVIQHYRTTGEWGLGYIYSTIAKDQFHGKYPSGCEWFVNPDFYNWKAQYYHSALCSKIGSLSEMAMALNKVLDYAEMRPEEFTQKQMAYFKTFRKAN